MIGKDVRRAFADAHIWLTLGWYDVLARYRRSVLGPWWITLSMAVTITAMGPLYGALFGQTLSDFVPHLGLGMIFWALITASITECCNAFNEAQHYLKQAEIPFSVFVLRVLWRQSIIFAHNFLLYPLILLIFWQGLNWQVLWFVPAFILVMVNLFWLGLLLAIFCTRYRDMLPVINSVMTLLFFITPIIWNFEQLPENRRFIAHFNPFTSLMNLLRDPLLGKTTDITSWVVALLMAVILCIAALWLLKRTRHRITYWL